MELCLVWRMGPLRGVLFLVVAHTRGFPIRFLVPSGFLQGHLNLSSSCVLIFHVVLFGRLYHSLNSVVLEAPLDNWCKQSWRN